MAPGRYGIVVDGSSSGTGPYVLTVRGTIAVNGFCNDPLVAAGVLTCADNTSCSGPAGMERCVPAACNDTIDADGDGFPGFPTDPGCTALNDADETDDCPAGPMCPQCANDLDDDTDGFTDYPLDFGCVSASGTNEECASIDPVIPFTANVVGASTVGDANDVDLTCGVDGRDDVYRLRLLAPLAELRVNTLGSALDTVLSIKRGGCASFDLQCDDNTLGNGDSAVFLVDVPAGDYFLVVDDRNVTSPGTYNLNVAGLYAPGAACDPTSTIFACTPGLVCAGATPTCVVAACNDAIDADGDTFNGFPLDPGCSSLSDNDEADTCPTGPGCPACSDDLDNDTDGRIDYPVDPGCIAASSTSEAECQIETDPLIPVTGPATPGTTLGGGFSDSLRPTCGSSSHAAPERVHFLTVRVPLATLHVDTNPTGFDNAISLMDATCGTTIQCGDSPTIDRTNVAPGGYAISVDGWGTGTGTYTLNVRGTIALGNSCVDPLVAAGVFTCVAGTICTGPSGMEACAAAACGDAVDADGDGFNGFPTDPGCSSVLDNDEADDCPTGPSCPQCSNGLDDDLDTDVDYPMDNGCTAAGGTNEECASLDPVIPFTANVVGASTSTSANDFDLSCGTDGRDAVYRLVVDMPLAELRANTIGSPLDTILSIKRDECSSLDLQCDDNTAGNGDSSVFLIDPVVGNYFLIIDDRNVTSPGTYNLNVSGLYANGSMCDPTSPFFLCRPGFVCAGPSGAETCVIAACNDAIDADGDTFVGYPTDPGCVSLSDNDEADNCPGGAGCPQCSDDLDNDSDGSIDFGMDVGCLAASANSELECQIETDPLIPVTGPATTGTTTTAGLSDSLRPTCGSSTHAAPERVHFLTVRVPLATLHVDTNPTGFDNALSLLDATCGTSIQCSDSPTIDRTNVAPGGYAISVDGWGVGTGTYTLNVRGTIALGGACNDPLVAAGVFTCPTGTICTGPSGMETCAVAACGDAIDADGDGFNGFPADPGCATVIDNDEADDCPSGPTCPQCSNGMDDDLDSDTDYPMDSGCVAAGGTDEECASIDPIIPFTGNVVGASTSTNANDFDLSCGTDGRDAVYRLVVDLPLAELRANTIGSPVDTVLSIKRDECSAIDLQCDDDTAGNGDSSVFLIDPVVGNYFLIVDDRNVTNPGTHNLNVSGLYANGSMCDPDSTIFTCRPGFACSGPSGAETCLIAACNDAIDADGDTFNGYPNDPGCASISDNDETDTCPSGPGCPQCSDDLDNDTDTRVDYPLDFGCVSAASTSELECQAELDPLLTLSAPVSTGTTVGAGNHFVPSCQASSLGDRVYILTLQVPVATLVMDTEGSTLSDSVLQFMNATCGLPPIECDDDDGTGNQALITRTNVAPGGYAILVDHYAFAGTSGPYVLNVRGTIAAGSSCNDPLVAAGVLACAVGTTCQANVCSP